MGLTPIQLVAVICAIVAAGALAYLAAERLAKMLDGRYRFLALAGLTVLNLLWAVVVASLITASGKGGGANFAILGLLPSVWMIRIADKPFPAAIRYGVVAIGAAVYLGLLSLVAWSMRNAPRDEITNLLGFAMVGAIVVLVVTSVQRIWKSLRRGAAS